MAAMPNLIVDGTQQYEENAAMQSSQVKIIDRVNAGTIVSSLRREDRHLLRSVNCE
jgi:hypothetical protein